ncbi:ATP-binding protein [Winogradskyella sp. SYSU M77433]|nr:ATP-binding protein [Winogradskyella sp. SYSU M77433]MDH7911324.1 ATP-binding protein [Winogradskyella sp. SYSU M77433]
MNSLLKRQMRKFLSEELKENKDLEAFLNAVDLSYNNFEEQSNMIQRAMKISSEELFEANRKLQREAKEQKELIDKLKNVINRLKFFDSNSESKEDKELNGIELVGFIENQAKEIVEINNQRELLLKELEHQNQELSDYAHMVSHDLKSPLRSVDTLTAWLMEDNKDKLDGHVTAQLGLIRSNVEKMDALINGILNYSTIGKNQIEAYNIDLNLLLKDVLKMMEIPKHVSIEIEDLPTIIGDKYRLQQLFQNLIGNAIKYNDKPQCQIKIGFSNKEPFWEFYVKDNGLGIEEQYFDKIFNTFEKLENNGDSTGIGLSIVKKIVEIYGGEIWLTSEMSKGTTFYFTIKKQPRGAA